MKSVISSVAPLSFPFKTLDPFLFCVYHKDDYPAGDEKLQAPRRGNGADFNPNSPYRMYHGDRIPGFPQHPHRGFETITATITGLIDHTDSAGNTGRYGQGDLQWKTAGKGIVHGEMFPLVNSDKPNPLKFFQIWINLPKASKWVDPAFKMHWAEEVPHYISEDGLTNVTIWAGSEVATPSQQTALDPPPNSWASKRESNVGIWHIELQPGAHFELPANPAAAVNGQQVNRVAYFTEGESLLINEQGVQAKCAATLDAGASALFMNKHASVVTEVLILQGSPIGEPVVQHGPFVMNTAEEIQQAFSDYRTTQFGGWPWPQDAVVFPREKTRFSLLNGIEQTLPTPPQNMNIL